VVVVCLFVCLLIFNLHVFPVDNIALLLNQTSDLVRTFVFNTTTFIAENDRLIGEIDDIISGLAGIHNSLSRVTAPPVFY